MATHSTILAWRIPGTGEPGGLPSLGLHRVGHDWSDLAAAAAYCWKGFPGSIAHKESTCNAGDIGNVSLMPGSGSSPGERKCKALQYSNLKNPRDRGAWQAGVTKSRTKLKRQRRKGKIYPSECRVPKNTKERKESLPKWSMQRTRKRIEWERLEISSKKLEKQREHFMQRQGQLRTETVWT